MTYEEMNEKWPFGNKLNGIAEIGWIICDETKLIVEALKEERELYDFKELFD